MKNLIFKNALKVAAVAGMMLLVLPFMTLTASAQSCPGSPGCPECFGPNPPPYCSGQSSISTVSDVFNLIERIFNVLFIVLLLLAGVFLIMAAFGYLTAGGEPENIKKANRKVIYTGVAVAVAVVAKAVPRVVQNFLV